MRLVILQSNYIPWKGYFDLMAMSDLFIVYDSVQYTKNDWRNRNLIATQNGPLWLTIPVSTAGLGTQPINEARVGDARWAKKHWESVRQQLARRPAFDTIRADLQACYEQAHDLELLHDINVLFLRMLATKLGIETPIIDDREFALQPDSPTGKLIQLCERTGADRYVTGPAGLNYLELPRFAEAGIALDVIDYGSYPTYEQTSAEFSHAVSVVDTLASVGPAETRLHLRGLHRTIATATPDTPTDDLSGEPD